MSALQRDFDEELDILNDCNSLMDHLLSVANVPFAAVAEPRR
jgi:hypothetical protein